MCKLDRPEWFPSETELIDELCNAREIDWPVEASKHFDYRDEWLITTFCDYDAYMKGLLKDGRNYPETPLRYMESPAYWRDKSLEFILNQIWSSPEEYQGYIMGIVNRYLTACLKRLDGKWPSDRWDGSGKPYFTRNCYTFCCPEWVGDDDLLKKIIVLQKLQSMISERVGQDTTIKSNEEQPGEPAAGDGAADGQRGRRVKLPQEVFEHEIFPVLDKEFPLSGANAGIKKRCAEIGKAYGVSESTIKSKFYDMQGKKRGNKSG
jgi:hypothetical protein